MVHKNEFGDGIPDHIFEKAKKMGCYKPAYIYKDGTWEEHNTFPASNLCIKKKSKRFEDSQSTEDHKVGLGDGWVVFTSRYGSKRKKTDWD